MQWCSCSPLWATESLKVTISRWMAQLLNWWAQERSELHLDFLFCAAFGSEKVLGDHGLFGFHCRVLWSSVEQVYGRKPVIGTGCSSFWVIFRTRHEVHPEQVHSQWRISPSLTVLSHLYPETGLVSALCTSCIPSVLKQGFSFHWLSLSHNHYQN